MIVAVVMTVMIAMTLVAMIGLSLMQTSLRTVGMQREAARALYCAEAGLAAGRILLAQRVGLWNTYLSCGQACPSGYPITGAAAPDGSATYSVHIEDNVDEFPPQANNPFVDNDLTVVMVARCTDARLPPRTIRQHLTYDYRQLPDYRAQLGFGRAGARNQN